MDFEEFMKSCGFTNENNNGDNPNFGAPFGCSDIPGGFQDLNPQLFILIGEIMGNCLAGNLPFNVQNAVGNWLQLVGQAILTYNSQQQYFQAGPGRYYDIRNKNVANSFCAEEPSGQDGSENASTVNVRNKKSKSWTIEELKEEIESLTQKVKDLETRIKDFEDNK
ncbi:MAG: hypothetical protein GX275_06405 [Clostridiales bacterium]|nr:hypothetical protein [Clostridiales bacterium]